MYTDHTETREVLEELRVETARPPEPPRYRLAPPLYAWVELDAPYEGARVEIRLNPPIGLLNRMQDNLGMAANLHEMIRTWNLDDEHGTPLEVSRLGVSQLEPDLMTAIMQKWTERRELSKRR